MLHLLDALILFACAVRAAVSVSPVTCRSSVRTDCPVSAGSAEETARSGRGEHGGYADGQSAPAAGVVVAGL